MTTSRRASRWGKPLRNLAKARSTCASAMNCIWLRPWPRHEKVTLNDLTRQALNEFLHHHSADAGPAIG